MIPRRLWLASIALRRRGFRRLARVVQRANMLLFHNSLSSEATVGPGVWLGHHAFGTVIDERVAIGRRATIWHNVTILAQGPGAHVTLGDDVGVGAGAAIIAPPGRSLTIGDGVRVGAGAVVTEDVPAGTTIVSASTRRTTAGDEGSDTARV